MVTQVASGRGRRRRFVAALFAYAEGVVTAESLPVADRSQVHADELVITMFNQEGPSLVRLARLFTDDRDAAEDLVQEAFIRLHRSARRIRNPAKAAPYLRSIVLNLARDHNRRGLMKLRHADPVLPRINQSCRKTTSCRPRTNERSSKPYETSLRGSEIALCSGSSSN